MKTTFFTRLLLFFNKTPQNSIVKIGSLIYVIDKIDRIGRLSHGIHWYAMQNKVILLNFFSFTNKYMQFSTFDFMWIYFVRSSVLYGKCFHHFRIFERYNTKLRTSHFQQRWHHHQARRPGRLVWDVFYLNHPDLPTRCVP